MRTVAVFPNLIKPETRDILVRIRAFFDARETRIMLPYARAAVAIRPSDGRHTHVMASAARRRSTQRMGKLRCSCFFIIFVTSKR